MFRMKKKIPIFFFCNAKLKEKSEKGAQEIGKVSECQFHPLPFMWGRGNCTRPGIRKLQIKSTVAPNSEDCCEVLPLESVTFPKGLR